MNNYSNNQDVRVENIELMASAAVSQDVQRKVIAETGKTLAASRTDLVSAYIVHHSTVEAALIQFCNDLTKAFKHVGYGMEGKQKKQVRDTTFTSFKKAVSNATSPKLDTYTGKVQFTLKSNKYAPTYQEVVGRTEKTVIEQLRELVGGDIDATFMTGIIRMYENGISREATAMVKFEQREADKVAAMKQRKAIEVLENQDDKAGIEYRGYTADEVEATISTLESAGFTF